MFRAVYSTHVEKSVHLSLVKLRLLQSVDLLKICGGFMDINNFSSAIYEFLVERHQTLWHTPTFGVEDLVMIISDVIILKSSGYLLTLLAPKYILC